MAMTEKRVRFVEEYLIDLNAAGAAARAGYSQKTAKEIGYRLLGMPEVAEAIAAAMRARSERTEISADKVLTELALLGFARMGTYMKAGTSGDPRLDLSGLTDEQTAALAEVTIDTYTDGRGDDARDVKRVRFKLHDKRGPLVDLGKHLGLFTEKHEHSGPGGKPIEVRTMSDDEVARRIAAVVAKIEADAEPQP